MRFVIFFIGFALVLISALWYVADFRKTRKFTRKAENEKNELRSIITDAELLINELNNFSDYLLTKIDQKNSEAGFFLEKLNQSINDAKLNHIKRPGKKRVLILNAKKYSGGRRITGRTGDGGAGYGKTGGGAVDPGKTAEERASSPRRYTRGQISRYAKRRIKRNAPDAQPEAIMSHSKKSHDVLRCYSEGMGEAEIAKYLDIGRGEVALILGLYAVSPQ